MNKIKRTIQNLRFKTHTKKVHVVNAVVVEGEIRVSLGAQMLRLFIAVFIRCAGCDRVTG